MIRLNVVHPNPIRALLLAFGLLVIGWAVATQPLLPVAISSVVIGSALLLIRWPWLIWPAIGALLPMAADVKLGPASGLDLLLLLAVALWFANGVRVRSLRLDVSGVAVLGLIYAGAQLVSSLNALDLGEALDDVVKWLEFCAVLLLVRQMTPPNQARWLVVGVLIGAIGQALIGLYQFVYQIGPEWFVILGRFMRASGSFHQPNPYAGYLGLCFPVALSMALWAWGELVYDWVGIFWNDRAQRLSLAAHDHWSLIAWTIFFSACSALTAAGLLASWSRGGWLGVIGGVIVVIALRSRRAAVAMSVAAIALLIAVLLGTLNPAFAPDVLIARIGDLSTYVGLGDVLQQEVNDDNFAVIERVAHWAAAIRMWESAPWLGVGAGNFPIVYPSVHLPRWDDPLGHAHNIYLNVLGETGLIGFTAFLLLWLVAVARLWRQKRIADREQARWSAALVVGVLGVLAHLAVHSLFDNLFVQGMYIQVALWLAIVDLDMSRFATSPRTTATHHASLMVTE